jgi:hypothetical protein
MTANQPTDEPADSRSLIQSFLAQLHGLLHDALVSNAEVLFPASKPEAAAGIYAGVSSAIGDSQAVSEDLDHVLLNLGMHADELSLALQRWEERKDAYRAPSRRRPADLRKALQTAEYLLLEDLAAAMPSFRGMRRWLRLILDQLEPSAGLTSPTQGNVREVAPLRSATIGPGMTSWRADERTDVSQSAEA